MKHMYAGVNIDIISILIKIAFNGLEMDQHVMHFLKSFWILRGLIGFYSSHHTHTHKLLTPSNQRWPPLHLHCTHFQMTNDEDSSFTRGCAMFY